MTVLDKSTELIEAFAFDNTSSGNAHGKKCAIKAVDEIYNAIYNYLKDTNELQNADREFSYWEEVKKEIEGL